MFLLSLSCSFTSSPNVKLLYTFGLVTLIYLLTESSLKNILLRLPGAIDLFELKFFTDLLRVIVDMSWG